MLEPQPKTYEQAAAELKAAKTQHFMDQNPAQDVTPQRLAAQETADSNANSMDVTARQLRKQEEADARQARSGKP